jgi:hypothetical protein
MPVVVRV